MARAGDMAGLYLSQWYLFKDHIELLDDITSGLPPFLLDDWLELIPDGWALTRATRNNIYWGAHASSTRCHWDNLNAQTWNITLRGLKRWLVFDGHAFNDPDRERVFSALEEAGFVHDGLWSVDSIRRYRASRPERFPPLQFFMTDVAAGDGIFIPPRWAHQVHNIGESLAVSRYYVNSQNYEGLRDLVREYAGAGPALVLDAILGGSKRRRFAKILRGPLSSKLGRWMFHGMMRHTPLYSPHHFLS